MGRRWFASLSVVDRLDQRRLIGLGCVEAGDPQAFIAVVLDVDRAGPGPEVQAPPVELAFAIYL